MMLFDTVKSFFKTRQNDPIAQALRDSFSAASDAYRAALNAIEPYTTRANHRWDAQMAARYRSSMPPEHHAADSANRAIGSFTDPDDFEPYNEVYLEAHTAAIDALTSGFDALTDSFALLNAAFKREATGQATSAKSLEQKAKAAELKAQVYVVKAEAAIAKAEAALEASAG